MNENFAFPRRGSRALAPAALLALAACTTTSPAPEIAVTPPKEEAPAAAAVVPVPSAAAIERLITPQSPEVRAWRKIAAGHIYKQYPKRIYKGRIPPLVYAVVVVETELDASGRVTDVSFGRIPAHAPEVPPMIAELIRAASPLPNPGALGAHTYIDVWLWDKSGRFQLDALTRGQRSR